MVSAYGAPADDAPQVITVTPRITDAVRQNKQRLLVVGRGRQRFEVLYGQVHSNRPRRASGSQNLMLDAIFKTEAPASSVALK